MAVIIPFYIPSSFHKKDRWIPLEQRGRIIEFVRRISIRTTASWAAV
jgi:hypothetical protein